MDWSFQIEQETGVPLSTESPILDVLDRFERSRHDLKPSTMFGYKSGVWRFTYYVANDPTLPEKREEARDRLKHIKLSDLTLPSANSYIEWLLKRKRKTMAHHDARSLVIFVEWCVTARILPGMVYGSKRVASVTPLSGFTVPTQPNHRRQPFQDSDIPIIRKAARDSQMGERDEAIVVLAIACALRKDEIRNLMYPEDVDLKGQMLYVRDRAAKTDASIRRVILEPEVIALLDEYIEDLRPSKQAGALFLNNHGDQMSYHGFASIIRRVKARLPKEMDFKLHRARNTGITNWLRAGNDLHTVMKLAGHKSPKVTERYAGEFTDDELRKLVRPSFGAVYGSRKRTA